MTRPGASRSRARGVAAGYAAACALALSAALPLAAGDLPAGYWPLAKSQRILDKTLVLRLQPDLSGLTPAEQRALDNLLEVGRISQQMYEEALHPQARAAHEDLATLDAELGSPPATQNLRRLYRLFQGPIATTLDNERLPFLPVDPVMPGKNVYPWGVQRKELDAYIAGHPAERASLLGLRTVVRRAAPAILAQDLAVLARSGYSHGSGTHGGQANAGGGDVWFKFLVAFVRKSRIVALVITASLGMSRVSKSMAR